MSEEIKKELNTITKTIIREAKPERIILFGSYANNTAKEGSDFDLFIIKKTSKRQIERDREIRRKLPEDRSMDVDLIVYNPNEVAQAIKEKNIFINHILKEGKSLYARK